MPNNDKKTPMCKRCPLRRTCTHICQYVEPLVPSMEHGRLDFEDLARIYQGRLVTHALLDNLHLLPPAQRQVVHLYYRENRQQREIAEMMTTSQQAVGDALRRARKTVGKKLRSYFSFL